MQVDPHGATKHSHKAPTGTFRRNKERNFQEEYAFKSAVALTIKAYSDVIKDDKFKDELKDTVEKGKKFVENIKDKAEGYISEQ